jgi:hypothetical protein
LHKRLKFLRVTPDNPDFLVLLEMLLPKSEQAGVPILCWNPLLKDMKQDSRESGGDRMI